MTSDDSEKSVSEHVPLSAIVLAAGRGTRMRSRIPKVYHKILGRSLLDHVLEAVAVSHVDETVIVSDPVSVGFLASHSDVEIAIQQLPLGTADAVAVGLDSLQSLDGCVLILNGDVPLVRSSTLIELVRHHTSTHAQLTFGSFLAPAGTTYGRVQRRDGRAIRVVEAAQDSIERSEDFEANGGVYCVDLAWLRDAIGKVPVSRSGEYYVTSLIEMAVREAGEAGQVETIRDRSQRIAGG